jgi:murein DD-endopeptidase MepM/ murein hydrolase activator NlpD
VDLGRPGPGRWLIQNSPANRVPSHGTALLATSYAIDFVPVDDRGRTAPVTARTLVRPEPPTLFPGFGRPVLAPAEGRVVAVHDGEVDHPAYRGFPSLRYALTQSRRLTAGWVTLAGNHVIIEVRPKTCVALCHLRRGSVRVGVGTVVRRGDQLADCGNSGNSTEPHVHLQAMDDPDPRVARALRISIGGELPRSGRILGAPEGKRAREAE